VCSLKFSSMFGELKNLTWSDSRQLSSSNFVNRHFTRVNANVVQPWTDAFVETEKTVAIQEAIDMTKKLAN
jgi:hypothetical protein